MRVYTAAQRSCRIVSQTLGPFVYDVLCTIMMEYPGTKYIRHATDSQVGGCLKYSSLVYDGSEDIIDHPTWSLFVPTETVYIDLPGSTDSSCAQSWSRHPKFRTGY